MLKETGTRISAARGELPNDRIRSPSESGELDASMSTTSTWSGASEDLDSEMSSDEPSTALSRIPQIRTIVEVPETLTSPDSTGTKVTLYKINVESNDICFHLPSSCVWRNYSDFVWLRKRLASSCSLTKSTIPDLPSRNLLNLFDKDFAERRKERLEEFLKEVVEDRSFLSDAALHLFLQSNLVADEIQAWLDKKMDTSVFELIQRGKELVSPHNIEPQIDAV